MNYQKCYPNSFTIDYGPWSIDLLEIPEPNDLPHLADGSPGTFAGFYGAVAGNLAQINGIVGNVVYLFADGCGGDDHIFGQLFFQVAVAYLAAVVQVIEMLV